VGANCAKKSVAGKLTTFMLAAAGKRDMRKNHEKPGIDPDLDLKVLSPIAAKCNKIPIMFVISL